MLHKLTHILLCVLSFKSSLKTKWYSFPVKIVTYENELFTLQATKYIKTKKHY